MMTRRQMLMGGVAWLGGALLVACGGSPAAPTATTKPAPAAMAITGTV